MPKRKSRPAAAPEFNLQQTISQSVVAWDDVAFSKLLEIQQSALGELGSIKTILELTKDIRKAETSATAIPTVVKMDEKKVQEELLKITKEQFVQSRKYYKKQEDFQKDWDKEAKNIAEMAKGMKTFTTLGERMAGAKEGFKEKFGSAGGLKKTMMGALNVGGVFNKSMERDKFVEQQRALGSTASTKDLRKDFEGAYAASKATKKTEAAIAKHKATAGIEDEAHLKRVSPEFAKLMEQRQSNADEFGKYQRATDVLSPTPVNRNITAGLTMTAAQKAKVAEKTATSTAAEAVQGQEASQESKRMSEEELNLLKSIAENTGGKKGGAGKKAEPVKAEGGSFLDTILGFLSTGLMTAFKAMFNPMTILKALGKVFAIGMIVGALFEGIMDGFDEFTKSGDIGKALIAGLAGIIDFLTFGLFDKEKIKEVIGDFAAWTSDHLIKPFTEFIGSVKDSFMKLIENIGVPEIKFKIPVIGKEVSIGPFYPFKSDAKPEAATPTAAAPTTANQVESQSADNAAAAGAPASSNSTNVVNAPVTTNNNSTQVQLRPPIRNQESSQTRYMQSKYA